MEHGCVALLTDFGISGPYVGAMKAVILGIKPDAAIIDITHQIGPQGIEEGAFLLSQVTPYLPPGTVCVAVVDPGVGTERPALAVQSPRGIFVGPDNGLLSPALSDDEREAAREAGAPALVPLPAGCQAVQLTNDRYFRHPVSNTFHGRDIFSPVGAHIAAGVPLAEFGPPAGSLLVLPPWRTLAGTDGRFEGRVVYTNHFGNIVTDIRGADLPGRRVVVQLAGQRFEGLQRSFQDGPEFVVYIGSSGYLEVARRNANAAAALGVRAGDRVTVEPRQNP
jgi:S-adenosylmethionine hydrolase